MVIPPKYVLNNKIVGLLQEIEHLKTQLDLLPQSKILEKYARQKSILQSALYSARIEGNPKTINEISLSVIRSSKEKTKLELNNLYHALEFILQKSWQKNIGPADLRNLHALVLKNLSSSAGSLRTEPSAIFNTAGVAVYVCPMPEEIKRLLEQWLDYVNKPKEQFIPIKSALAHFCLEKIHPFLDGNGRVGRLLTHLVFRKWQYDLRGLVSFEKYFDSNREDYYDYLNIGKADTTPFVEFFLTGLKVSLEEAVINKSNIDIVKQEDTLPLRRYEILQIIRDHRQIAFDIIQRRFMAVSARLLRYELKKLQDQKFIKKRGVTKGVIYEPI